MGGTLTPAPAAKPTAPMILLPATTSSPIHGAHPCPFRMIRAHLVDEGLARHIRATHPHVGLVASVTRTNRAWLSDFGGDEEAFYPDVDVALFAASVIGNGIAFPLGFAIPFMILLQEELGFAPIDARLWSRSE